jgi:hypothetical protein
MTILREIIKASFAITKLNAFAVLGTLLLFTSSVVYAQLERYPTKRTEFSQTISQANPSGRLKAEVSLTLPFFDDFSKTNGLFPNRILWDSSDCVWINNAMAINPPTYNVATLDGLDSAGLAYSADPASVLRNGFTDSLTSKRIDLSLDGLPLGERFSLFLSFFFQWKGRGEAPDPGDFLQVEFRDAAKKWIPVMTIKTKSSFKADAFYDTILQVNEERWFHTEFQFRFRTFGRESGPFDTWNVDYVYLNSNRTINDLSFPDQAISSTLGPLFGIGYRAMPYEHFKAGGQLVAPQFTAYNLRAGEPDVVTYVGKGSFFNYFDGVPTKFVVSDFNTTNVETGVGANGEFQPLTTETVTLQHLPDVTNDNQFDPNADSVIVNLTVDLKTGDDIPKPDGDYEPRYAPISFLSNDTIKATYTLSNYYAYDDGHAEYSAGLVQPGNLVAYEFELQGVTQDTLTGFDIYLPAYSVSDNQTVDFFVYGEKQFSTQTDTLLLGLPPKTIQRKGIDEFQRITFLPAILVPSKKFYIGWREPANSDVLVGLDANNDTGNRIWVNTNGTWYRNNRVVGSLMVRPVFGKGEIDPVLGLNEELNHAVYPNPSNGSFYIEGDVDKVELITITGQQIEFKSERIDEQKIIVTLNQPAGLYILRTSKGPLFKTQKIVINR